MRIRTIKPEFFLHEGLFEAERAESLPLRIAFAGLWCAADREGRFKWEPRRLGVQILPYDDVDFSRVLDALVTRGFLVKYASEGIEFGFIPSFKRHQIINNKERDSMLPKPLPSNISDACPTRAPRVPDACHKERKGKEGKGREQEKAPLALGPWEIEQGIELPEPMRNDQCKAAILTWLAYKRERGQTYKPRGLAIALGKWANEFTPDQLHAAVEHSIANNWAGLFPSHADHNRNGAPKPHRDDNIIGADDVYRRSAELAAHWKAVADRGETPF